MRNISKKILFMNVQIFFLFVFITCILTTSDFDVKSKRKSCDFPPWCWLDARRLSKVLEKIHNPTPIHREKNVSISFDLPPWYDTTSLSKVLDPINKNPTPIQREKNLSPINRSIPKESEKLIPVALKKEKIGMIISNSIQLASKIFLKSQKENSAINSRKSTNCLEHSDMENEQNMIRNLKKAKKSNKLRLPHINPNQKQNESYPSSLMSSQQKFSIPGASMNQSFSEAKFNYVEEKKPMPRKRLLPELKGPITQFNYEERSPENDAEIFINYVSREVYSIDHDIWTPSKKYRNVKLKKIDDLICGTKISIWKFQSKKIGTQIKNNFGIVTLNHQTKIAKTHDTNGNHTDLEFTEVENVFATSGAFAFLKIDGTVELSGYEDFGGRYNRNLKDVTKIIPNKYAFCALTIEHKVRCWGDPKFGGKIGPMIFPPIQKIVATQAAFAALGHNNMVFTWGSKDYGGTEIYTNLASDVECIVSTPGAFAAKQKLGVYMPRYYDGNQEILVWGLEKYFLEAEKKLKKAMKFY